MIKLELFASDSWRTDSSERDDGSARLEAAVGRFVAKGWVNMVEKSALDLLPNGLDVVLTARKETARYVQDPARPGLSGTYCKRPSKNLQLHCLNRVDLPLDRKVIVEGDLMVIIEEKPDGDGRWTACFDPRLNHVYEELGLPKQSQSDFGFPDGTGWCYVVRVGAVRPLLGWRGFFGGVF